jgi:hypothetical protein
VEYNETADKAARLVVDGETTQDTILQEEDPPIEGLRTWPQTRHTPPNKPKNIRKLTNLKAGIIKKLKHTNKMVTITRVFGRLLKEARGTGTNFSIQAFSQSPYKSKRDAYEVAWRSHVYQCKKRHNSQGPMICTKCSQPLNNTYLLGGCEYNAKLCTSIHKCTFKLLQDQLEKHNGGRWPIVRLNLGNKTIKDFKTQTQIEMITPQADPTLQALEATQEGLQDDKMKPLHPTIIPTDLLPKHKRPQHHKPDIIRAIEYRRNSQRQLVEDTTYKERRCLQLIECKYSTVSNTLDTMNSIHNIYEPLKHAIIRHNRNK